MPSDRRPDETRANPAPQLRSPDDIANAEDLSRDQKIEFLRQREQDLRQLMTASGERMIPVQPTQAPEMLRTVRALLRRLEQADS